MHRPCTFPARDSFRTEAYHTNINQGDGNQQAQVYDPVLVNIPAIRVEDVDGEPSQY